MKKKIALLLIAASLLTAFVGCGEEKYEYDPLPESMKNASTGNYVQKEPDSVQNVISDFDIPDGAELDYDIDFSDYIQLPEINNETELDYTPLPKDGAAIDAQIFSLRLEKAKRKEINNRAAAEGDVLTVNCSGVYYGTKEKFTDSKNVEVVLGQGQLIDEVEALLYGMAPGQTKVHDFVYPAEHTTNPILSRAKVTVTVELVKIEEADIPELNDATIKSFGIEGVTTEKALREYVLTRIELTDELKKQDALYQYLLKESKIIAFPQTEFEYYKTEFENVRVQQAEAYGVTFEDVILSDFTSRENYELQKQQYAQQKVCDDLIVLALADEHDVELTKNGYNKALQGFFNERDPMLGIETIKDFHEKMGVTVYKTELRSMVMAAVLATME